MRKFVVMVECVQIGLSVIAAECVPDGTTSRAGGLIFETKNSSKKDVLLMRK
jgi:hypothetical protein